MSRETVALPGGISMRIDYLCGAAALCLALLAVWVSIAEHDYRITLLIRMTQGDPIAAETRGNPDFAYTAVHYDGIYYFAIALDPLAQARPHTEIDLPAIRYGHPAYGWAAGLLGLFGPTLVPLSLVVVSLAAMFAAGVYASRLASLLGWSAWGGLIIAFNPGLIFAVVNDTAEAFAAAVLCLSLWAWLSGRVRLATVAIVVGCFAKEHLLLVPLGLATWEVVQLIRGGPRDAALRRLGLLAIGPALYAAWTIYVHSIFGAWPFDQASNLSLPIPFSGWLDAMLGSAEIATNDYLGYQLGGGNLPLNIVALGLIVAGMVRAVRFRSPIDPVYLLMGVLMVYLAANQLFFAKDLMRGLAFAFVLLPFVLITPRWPPRDIALEVSPAPVIAAPGAST